VVATNSQNSLATPAYTDSIANSSRKLRTSREIGLLGGRFLQVTAERVAHRGKKFVLIIPFAA
jgi:hypothetical protein